eukprot:CAMPEP_0197530442 /NCGR_PEP_ID=MMETSP1318-20131121/31915_1 /TAXON_ID=552666 /ORGANISM="Partenskyella glossopodia, Strain RCC365" /LENGTH=110 /DNA_ID=CAMNT_0043086289 /DNA_START=41 /DNA_END=373 /DNA_ORIENTATION=-
MADDSKDTKVPEEPEEERDAKEPETPLTFGAYVASCLSSALKSYPTVKGILFAEKTHCLIQGFGLGLVGMAALYLREVYYPALATRTRIGWKVNPNGFVKLYKDAASSRA